LVRTDHGQRPRTRTAACAFLTAPPRAAADCVLTEELGYVLVDTPMMAEDDGWLDMAEATWAKQTEQSGAERSGSIAREYAELIAHPFFEAVAKQMLRTDRVHTIEHGAEDAFLEPFLR
jgi:hypothetical protein